MKSVETKITLNNNIPTISRKKHINTTGLSFVARAKGDFKVKLSPVDSCQACIRLPEKIKSKLNDKYCVLVNSSNGLFIDVTVDDRPTNDPQKIEMTSFVTRTIKADEQSELIICKQNCCEFDSVKMQTLNNIKDDVMVLPCGTFIEEIINEFYLFEIINPLTNDSIYIRSKHIEFEPMLKNNEIRLNKKQRNMLSDNIPTRLNGKQWDKLMESCQVDDSFKQTLSVFYAKDFSGYTISKPIDELDYNTKRSLQKYIKDSFGEKLIVRPVLESFRYEKKKYLYRRFCDFFVGKSTLSLNCRRPHECDENSDIVRISESNMLFLGIEPMDRVVIRFKEKEIACHVLPFCDDKFERTNIPSIIELSIGIPAHIRNELKISDIQSSVKVDRDTNFIFKKSFNEQLVPIILTLLSLKFFEDLPWYFSLALVVILVPIVMYVTLSSKRNMRGR